MSDRSWKESDESDERATLGKDRQRLSKVLAKLGIASRRKAETAIQEGRVTVNGEVVTVPQTIVELKTDKIVVDGKLMRQRFPHKVYFALNKPNGYLCSNKAGARSESGGKLVLDLFKEWIEKWKRNKSEDVILPRLFTVGRLDKQSSGLLLVTNDGDWAQKVGHPSSGLTKEYVVHTDPEAKMQDIRIIGAGCDVDGKHVAPVGVAKESTFLRIVVSEGRNKEVRTLVENSGLLVKSLKRVRIGGYRMPSDLKPGDFKKLHPFERRRLLNLGAQNNA